MTARIELRLPALVKCAAIAAVLAGAGSGAHGATVSTGGGFNSMNMSRMADGRSDLADAGTPAFSYKDGFWDVRHAWHAWASDDELQSYRQQASAHFHAWNHDRDENFGWLGR